MTTPPGSTGDVETVDVLVVGAGPTGLALASSLAPFGVSVKVVDLKPHPVTESRALALQPRTLEVLRDSVTDRLVERGNPAVELRWHTGDRSARLPLFDMGMADTAYPFLLFLSQAETEEALVEHLHGLGVPVEWNTRLTGYATRPSALPDEAAVACELGSDDGARRTVLARYLVGCDGAHSIVREQAGIPFAGGRYPQTFLLADLDAEGLSPDAAHAWFGPNGPLFFFPLARPAAWRMLTPRPEHRPHALAEPGPEDATVRPGELQAVVDAATGGAVRLEQPVWSTAFRIHHRQATSYRAGPVFLAGDAAHIHSPAGAQGMNTGIQDAVNLAWKLALVCRGRAPERLLDSYDRERRPVGTFVLRFTDRAFTAATSASTPVRLVRTHLAPRALALAAHLPSVRAVAFRTVSQLAVRYPDTLRVASSDVVGAAGDERTRAGRWAASLHRTATARRARRPGAGERVPDAEVTVQGRPRWLQDSLSGPSFHLLLCGPLDAWSRPDLERVTATYGDLVRVHALTADGGSSGRRDLGVAHADVMVDHRGQALRRLGVRTSASLLVRPDGHVATRHDGTDLSTAQRFLATWLTPTDA